MAYKFGEQLSAGDLIHRVTVQVAQYNIPGDEITGYTDVATVWASVEPLRGRELMEANRETSELDTRIRIRYRSGMDTAKRVVFGSIVYDVRSVINPHMSNNVLELMCRTVV